MRDKRTCIECGLDKPAIAFTDTSPQTCRACRSKADSVKENQTPKTKKDGVARNEPYYAIARAISTLLNEPESDMRICKRCGSHLNRRFMDGSDGCIVCKKLTDGIDSHQDNRSGFLPCQSCNIVHHQSELKAWGYSGDTGTLSLCRDCSPVDFTSEHCLGRFRDEDHDLTGFVDDSNDDGKGLTFKKDTLFLYDRYGKKKFLTTHNGNHRLARDAEAKAIPYRSKINKGGWFVCEKCNLIKRPVLKRTVTELSCYCRTPFVASKYNLAPRTSLYDDRDGGYIYEYKYVVCSLCEQKIIESNRVLAPMIDNIREHNWNVTTTFDAIKQEESKLHNRIKSKERKVKKRFFQTLAMAGAVAEKAPSN